MSTPLEQLKALAEQLSLEEKKRGLEFIRELVRAETGESVLPPGSPGSVLLRFSLPEEDVDTMEQTITENFEKL